MNSAKNILNKQDNTDETANKPVTPISNNNVLGGGGGGSNKKPIILGAICVVIVLIVCIGVGVQQLQPQRVVTIKGAHLTMDDMMYPIYEQESMYLPMDETYQYIYGSSVWEIPYQGTDTSVASGTNNSDGIKQEVLNSETQYEVLYQEAEKAGYKLTDEEQKDAEKQADEALKGLTGTQKLQLAISKKKLTKRFGKRILADRYKADKQEELNKEVDEAAAIADISKTDLRQYDIDYYYVPLTSTDNEGNNKEISKSDKSELAQEIKALAKKAATAKDFTTLIEDEEKSDIKYNTGNFTEKSGWTFVSEDNLKKIKALKNNEISEVFLDEKAGYYVFVKMLNNNSNESYENECQSAIKTKQDEKYQEWYSKLEGEYDVKVNADIWDDVTIGSVTTGIVTAEDLQKMSEEASSGTSE